MSLSSFQRNRASTRSYMNNNFSNFSIALRSALREVDRRTAKKDNNSEIPDDIIIEVLFKLPLKTLANFECVSKRWLHTIRNTIPPPYDPKLFILSCSRNKRFSFLSLDNQSRFENVSIPIDEHLLLGHKVRALCSCNGSLLIQIDCDLIVWNPLTKFFRKVLTYEGLDEKLADLCYDYTSDEYKVVVVKAMYFKEIFYVANCGAISWKKIDVPCFVSDAYPGPFFKGYRHWICKDRRSKCENYCGPRNHIINFDPRTDEFFEISMPKPKNTKYDVDNVLGLGVCDECLCMTRWDDPQNYYERNIEFLVMKEYGNGNSWDIMFVVSNTHEFLYCRKVVPLFKTNEGEILVSLHGYRSTQSVKAYDFDGNFLRDILSKTFSDSFDVVYYEESWFAPIVNGWDISEEIFGDDDDWSDSDYEEYSSFELWNRDEYSSFELWDREEYSSYDLWDRENSIEEEIQLRKKKRIKRMEKKFNYIKIATKHSRMDPSWRNNSVEIPPRRKTIVKRNWRSKRRYMNSFWDLY